MSSDSDLKRLEELTKELKEMEKKHQENLQKLEIFIRELIVHVSTSVEECTSLIKSFSGVIVDRELSDDEKVLKIRTAILEQKAKPTKKFSIGLEDFDMMSEDKAQAVLLINNIMSPINELVKLIDKIGAVIKSEGISSKDKVEKIANILV